jgi:signal transduction histidine kinase
MATIDTTYLREALHNLILNSRDACHESGSITVELQQGDSELLISISDTGQGMDDATVAAARLPYFSTKLHGTGLGLAIVEKSINEMKGRLKVSSVPHQGTTVSIILPLFDSSGEA